MRCRLLTYYQSSSTLIWMTPPNARSPFNIHLIQSFNFKQTLTRTPSLSACLSSLSEVRFLDFYLFPFISMVQTLKFLSFALGLRFFFFIYFLLSYSIHIFRNFVFLILLLFLEQKNKKYILGGFWLYLFFIWVWNLLVLFGQTSKLFISC